MNNRLETVKCNVCQSDNYGIISTNRDKNLPINLVICKNCGLAYLNPRWNKESYSSYYKTEYDKQYRPEILNNKGKPKPQNNSIVERIKETGIFQTNPQNILEIGSGDGKNLIDLKNIFPDSYYYAIEPSVVSQKILKQNKIELISDDIDKLWEKNFVNHFDFIVMRHVLEHFLYPDVVLKKIRSTLKDSGIIYIAVPNNYLKNRNNGWLRIAHTFYFNKNSLSNLLRKELLKSILLKEGDKHNRFEIFTFAKKSRTYDPLEISQKYYSQQRDVFRAVLKKEKKLSTRIKTIIIKTFKKYFC